MKNYIYVGQYYHIQFRAVLNLLGIDLDRDFVDATKDPNKTNLGIRLNLESLYAE